MFNYPIGFRVGYTRDWEDIWFSYNFYYPEFLHFVLKVRLFLTDQLSSFPDSEDLDKSSIELEKFPWFLDNTIELSNFFSKVYCIVILD